MKSFSLFLDNSGGGADQTYLFGDGTGMLSELEGLVGAKAPDNSQVDPAIIDKTLKVTPLNISKIEYLVSDTDQFGKKIGVITGNIDGTVEYTDLTPQVKSAENNSKYTNVRTLDFAQKPLRISQYSCLLLVVKQAETVTLNLVPASGQNRGSCGCKG